MKDFSKNLALWLVLILMMILLFNMFNQPQAQIEKIIFSDFVSSVEKGDVEEVLIQGSDISGKKKDGKAFKTYAPEDPELIRILREKGVRVSAKPEDQPPWYVNVLVSWFPMLLLIAVWIFFMRQMQPGGGKAMAFGKSRAKLLSEQQKVTFKDVAGIEEAKEELVEIIHFLKDPQKFTKLGGRIPKGVLLMGTPGSGKTLLAKAIAGEAGVPFFSISGSDFVEMFVGVGASRVRDLFMQGKKNAPCIIFIDEIDAVGRHRGGVGFGGGHDEREQTLNQLLVEMDGFESNEGVIIIAATNRPDVLDPALLRPGRFDRQVYVPTPDVKGREEILKVHTAKLPLAPNVDFAIIARGTPGFSGADLANLVNEAALLAARHDRAAVEMADFEAAKDKVMMGAERRSMIISDEEKKNTAYHEAGHALVAKLMPGTDPVHKVTIIPRGRALGLTQQLPIDERHTYARDYLMKNLAVLMGGRAAEEIVLNHTTTGAGNDIERATELARKMVCEWGMSEKLGPLTFGKKEEMNFLGKDFSQSKNYSESTAVEIDGEIRRIVTDSYNRAKGLLTEHLEKLHAVASALLEKEVLDGVEIDSILHTGGGASCPA